MEVNEALEGGWIDGPQVHIVAQVQLLQFVKPIKCCRFNEADVVGVNPKDGHVAAGGEAGGPDQGNPVVVQEDALGLDGDFSGDSTKSL